jgi:hypothetical protein
MHELQAFGPGCAFTPPKSPVSAAKEQQSAELSIFLRNSVSRVESSVFQAPLTKPTSATSSLQISAHPIKYRHRPITIYLSISTITTTSNSVAARSSILSTHPASPLSQSAHVVTQRAAGVGDHDGRAPRQGTAGSEPSERALRPTESVVQDLACGAAIAAVRHWCS